MAVRGARRRRGEVRPPIGQAGNSRDRIVKPLRGKRHAQPGHGQRHGDLIHDQPKKSIHRSILSSSWLLGNSRKMERGADTIVNLHLESDHGYSTRSPLNTSQDASALTVRGAARFTSTKANTFATSDLSGEVSQVAQPSPNRFPAFALYFAGTSFSPWMWARSFSFSLQYASRMSESGMSACVNLMVNGCEYMTGSLKVISTSMCP